MSQKTFHVIALLLGAVLLMAGCSTTVTSVYVLRHAEKGVGADPALTPAGQQRAQDLARVLENVPLAAVYSTDTLRTRQTVQPLADRHNLETVLYTRASIVGTVMTDNEKQTVVVVGHSDTVPSLIEAFGGSVPYTTISGNQFDNLFLLIVKKEKRLGSSSARSVKVLHMKYGAVSPGP